MEGFFLSFSRSLQTPQWYGRVWFAIPGWKLLDVIEFFVRLPNKIIQSASIYWWQKMINKCQRIRICSESGDGGGAAAKAI